MKNKVFFILFSIMAHPVFAQVPLDNPVAAHYNDIPGYPAWTDKIKWSSVIDMSSYSKGANDFEKFENARDELYAKGGGVLYYPSGTYDFSAAPSDGPNGRGLMLKSGIIIRGATPTGDKDAKDGKMDLPTKFLFKFNTKGGGQVPRDWNIIGVLPAAGEQLKDVNNVGIAWVHVAGAVVYFGQQMNWGATWGTAGSWQSSLAKNTWKNRVPDGTHPMDPFNGGGNIFKGAGCGRLVFGCIFDDAAVMNDAMDFGFGPSGFYMYKFGARIGVYGSDVLIANNALPKSKKNFKYSQLTCETDQNSGCTKKCLSTGNNIILFDYGKTCGIDVNKELLGLAGFGSAGYYMERVVVQDNYVYNHGHKGFNVSGKWVIIRNNNNDRDYLKEGDDVYGLGTGWLLTMDGNMESTPGGSGCISDNLARAYDIGGQAVWIDNNQFNNTGSDPGNDGEGILCQSHGGTQIFSWAITRNKHVKGIGETGYIGGYDVHHYGSLIAWNECPGWVGNIKAGDNIDAAFVNNNAAGGAQSTGTDVITSCPSGTSAAPANVKATALPDSGYVIITWSDASNNEIGFRIDRSFDNQNWIPVVYRPRKSQGTSYNEQKWVDMHAPRGKNLYYRVVAVNCSDAGGSSPAPGPVKLSDLGTFYSEAGQDNSKILNVFPNPATEKASVRFSADRAQEVSISLSDIFGRKVKEIHLRYTGGEHEAAFDTYTLPAGTYIICLKGESMAAFRHLTIIK